MNKKFIFIGLGIALITALTYSNPFDFGSYTNFGANMFVLGLGFMIVGFVK